MKYNEIFSQLKEQYSNINFTREDIEKVAVSTNNITSKKTIRNIIGIFKNNDVIKEIYKNKYIIADKLPYSYRYETNENKIYNAIKKEYPKINVVVWNTGIINEFTLHYVIKNFIIVEVERIAINGVTNLLSNGILKKFTITTQEIFINNREIFDNVENLIIVKPLNVKAPILKQNNKSSIILEKVMVDLYVDKLYLTYQGKELKTIYENIFNTYNIDLLKMISYAKYRITNINDYIEFINKLNIPKKYKLKE